jgi:hypothetical protein
VFTPLLAPWPGGGRCALLEVLGQVRDLRDPRGVRHSLAAILAMAVAAVGCGERSLTAIAQWAKCAEADQELLASLGARRHSVTGRYYAPHEDTFDRVLGGAVDPQSLDDVSGRWMLTLWGARSRPGPVTWGDAPPRGRQHDGQLCPCDCSI